MGSHASALALSCLQGRMGYPGLSLPAAWAFSLSSREPGTYPAPGPTSLAHPSSLQTLPQPAVQGQELPQEASIGDDASVVLDFLDGLHEGEAVVQHEVGEHQRGGSAHSHSAVHQDLPCEDGHAGGCWRERATPSVRRRWRRLETGRAGRSGGKNADPHPALQTECGGGHAAGERPGAQRGPKGRDS